MLEAKYLNIAEELEARIESGLWEEKLPGVAALSKELGANPRTVSKAIQTLSDKGKVTVRGTRGAFITRNRPARQRFNTIGVLGLLHKQKKEVGLTDVEEVVEEHGYHILGIEHRREMVLKNPSILSHMPVDGLLCADSSLICDVIASLRQAGIPFVSVNRVSEVSGVNWVDFDSEKGYREVLEHLLSLGHRRIAFIGFREKMDEYAERMESVYRETLELAGCYDPSLYIHDGDIMEYYRRYGEQYCSIYGMEKTGYLMNREYRPTAVFAGGIEIGQGVCRQVEQMGMSVPEHVSVAAVSQRRQDAEKEAFLTVVTGSVRKRARRATEILLELIDDPTKNPTQELLPMELILRDSVGSCTS